MGSVEDGVGCSVRSGVGMSVGSPVGVGEVYSVGASVGDVIGIDVGSAVEPGVGSAVEVGEGYSVGSNVGSVVGDSSQSTSVANPENVFDPEIQPGNEIESHIEPPTDSQLVTRIALNSAHDANNPGLL